MQVKLTLLIIAALLMQPAYATVDSARGKALYETFCTECHASTIHVQQQQKVKNFASLQATVANRAKEFSKLNWSEQEILDVTHYLNDQYYHFDF